MTKTAAKEITPARTVKVTETDTIYTLKIGPGCRITFGPSIPAPPRQQRQQDPNGFGWRELGPRPMEYALRIYGPGGKDDLVGVFTQVRSFQVIELIEKKSEF